MVIKNDILLSHSGKQHAYKVALSLQKLGRLSRFITSSYYDLSRFPDRLFSRFSKLDGILKRRYEPGLSDKAKRFPFFEAPELLLRSIFGNNALVSNATCLRDILFDKFVSKTQIHNCKIFWGFQGSCLNSLKAARQKGITAVAEFTTAHVLTAVEILEEERKKNPEWADSISNLYFPEWYLKRLKEEPFVADYCIAASGFSKRSLKNAGIKPENILILPLGVDLEKFTFKERKMEKLLRILFVGGVGQRKGIKYLLDAVKKLHSDKITLKIAGPIVGSGKALRKYSDYYEYLGLLSQEEIVKLMHENDCLILPSLLEGFPLVILEAMASGIPVIASTHSSAPEVIREGIDGFVLEPHDVEGLVGKLDWLMAHRGKALEMGANARERTKEFSWEKHAERLGRILQVIEG